MQIQYALLYDWQEYMWFFTRCTLYKLYCHCTSLDVSSKIPILGRKQIYFRQTFTECRILFSFFDRLLWCYLMLRHRSCTCIASVCIRKNKPLFNCWKIHQLMRVAPQLIPAQESCFIVANESVKAFCDPSRSKQSHSTRHSRMCLHFLSAHVTRAASAWRHKAEIFIKVHLRYLSFIATHNWENDEVDFRNENNSCLCLYFWILDFWNLLLERVSLWRATVSSKFPSNFFLEKS